MKQLLVTDVLGDDGAVIGNDFDDSAEIDLFGSNVLKIADGNQCVLLNTDSFATIVLRPVVEKAEKFLDDDACAACCGKHGCCGKNCECHENTGAGHDST